MSWDDSTGGTCRYKQDASSQRVEENQYGEGIGAYAVRLAELAIYWPRYANDIPGSESIARVVF